ncbi:group III truncated hemoglobin [Paracoccaceae bacterium Fryx2]|nr:group III truncated hemoglobin [Paracoccaceae bacterium Fryx2]
MTAFPPRFFVTGDEIDRVVTAFYIEVRRHPVLGPVFATHVQDWPAHEAKISRFWHNAILRSGGYEGRPQVVHREAAEVLPEHFPIWLALFDATAARLLAPQAAASWGAMAHRLGHAFRIGVEDARCQVGGPVGGMPKLR